VSHAAEEHPDLVRLRERITEAQERGYTEGDVNNDVQPVIGQMRLVADRVRQHGGTAVQVDLRTFNAWVARLERACQAELAWLNPADPT
jgi:hypothetical protein